MDNTADDQAEPAIGIHPLDPLRLVAGANSGRRTQPRVPSVKAYYSSDGGNTWSIKTNLPKPLHNGAADPSVVFDRNGNWFYGYLNYYYPPAGGTPDSGTVFVAKSTNNGTSWTATQVDPNKVPADFEDKPYIAVDNTGLTYNGRVYVSWTYFPDAGGSSIKFAYSTNQAQSFSTPVTLSSGTAGGAGLIAAATVTTPPAPGNGTVVQGSVPAVGPNGEVYVMWVSMDSPADGSPGTIQVRKSTNGGVSFTTLPPAAQVTGAATTRLGGLDIRTYLNATIAVDQNTGNIYIAWTEYKSGPPPDFIPDLDVYYVYSTNGGASWVSPQVATATITNWQFFPWLSVDPTGKVYLTYLQRVDQTTNNVDVYVAESLNNGASFSTPNLRITSVSSNAGNAQWTHHYQGITSRVGYVFPAWADYRNGNADIFASRVNRPPTSNSNLATAYNNGRRLVRNSDGSYHLAYTTNGEIYYAKSTDSGTTWTDHTRVSSGNGNNGYPSIVVHTGKLYVVWQRNTSGNNYDIHFRRNLGSGWGSTVTLGSVSFGSANNPLPALTVKETVNSSGQRKIRLVTAWKASSAISFRYSDDDGAAWATAASLPSTTSSHQSPSLSPGAQFDLAYLDIFTTYDDASKIYLNNYHTDLYYYTTAWGTPEIVPGSSGTSAKFPQVTGNQLEHAHIVWQGFEPIVEIDAVYYQRKSGIDGSWSAVQAYLRDDNQRPTITNLGSGNLAMFWWSAGSLIYKASYTYSTNSWSSEQFATSGFNPNPSVSFGSANPPSAAKYIWTSGSTSPYQIPISSETLQKSMLVDSKYHRRIMVADTSEAIFLLDVGEVYIQTKGGAIIPMEFVAVDDTLLNLTDDNLWNHLETRPISLPPDADSVVVEKAFYSHNANRLFASKVTGLTVGFELVDANNRSVVTAVGNELQVGQSGKVILKSKTQVSSLAGKNVFLRPVVRGLAKGRQDFLFSLIHVHYATDLLKLTEYGQPVPSNKMAREYNLNQNYPNPFNPITTITYHIPEDGFVSLKVYNLLGAEVATLVEGLQKAGEHRVQFDGNGLVSGVYFCRLRAGNFSKVIKLSLLQ